MSGGIAYVYNPKQDFESLCNSSTFDLENLEIEEDINELKTLIKNHHKYTGSKIAKDILDNWEIELHKFTKVMPSDYKRVLQERSEKLKEAETVTGQNSDTFVDSLPYEQKDMMSDLRNTLNSVKG